MEISKTSSIIASTIIALGLSLLYVYGRSLWVPVYQKVVEKETVVSVIEKYGKQAETRLLQYFEEAGASYPPEEVKLLAIKDEKRLELWVLTESGYKRIKDYTVRAASGVSGPKLVEGDEQVPEGLYKIVGLNPNSSYHLSMKLNYPNEFDLEHAAIEGRTSPGSNIFIHGKSVSIGCLAMGDRAIEELFTLIHKVGVKNSEVIIAPSDPRKGPITPPTGSNQHWIPTLYRSITAEFIKYREIET